MLIQKESRIINSNIKSESIAGRLVSIIANITVATDYLLLLN